MSTRIHAYFRDAGGREAAVITHRHARYYFLYAPGLGIHNRAFTKKALRVLVGPHLKSPEEIDGLLERAELGQHEAITLLDNHRRARAALRLLAKLCDPL